MKYLHRLFIQTLAGLLLFLTTGRPAEATPAEADLFEDLDNCIRIASPDGLDSRYLQTAIVRLQHSENEEMQVDIVGVVHIAEPAYYRDLNLKFKDYDAVFYELVAAKGRRPVQGMEADGPIGTLQNFMADELQLVTQMSRIDYQADNFAHADLSPEALSARYEERTGRKLAGGEDILKELLRDSFAFSFGFSEEAREPSPHSVRVAQLTRLAMLYLTINPSKVKPILAELTIASLKQNLASDMMHTLIVERNLEAIRVLENTREKQELTQMALFYGAAHVPDFVRKLEDRGYTVKNRIWLNAWDLSRERSRPEED